jgi:hypothetical protein
MCRQFGGVPTHNFEKDDPDKINKETNLDVKLPLALDDWEYL